MSSSRNVRWSRRKFIKTASLATVVSPLLASCASFPVASRTFRHGIASGDPLHDRVVIWTRVSMPLAVVEVVDWELATDKNFVSPVAAGSEKTGPETDYTVAVDVAGLAPNTTYYYRFRIGNELSAVGRTKTLPIGDIDSIAFAVVSCSNYPAGYFNVYDAVAGLSNIDAVLHLGDYIYEYGEFGYQTRNAKKLNRVPEPRHEIISLSDYRTRYAQYRSDASLQAMHAMHPMIAVWDDHEFANNSSQHGAQNHTADEGSWRARQQSAARAFREWLPLRKSAGRNTIYRSFEFGNLATLAMLDTRIAGRDPIPGMASLQSSSDSESRLSSAERAKKFRRDVLDEPSRTLLGAEQTAWLRATLKDSAARNVPWQILGQQIVMDEVIAPDLSPLVSKQTLAGMSDGLRRILEGIVALGKLKLPVNLDSWDGYAMARENLFADLLECANNTIVLSGDSHSAGASDLVNRSGEQVAVEFAVTSVTSSGFGAYLRDTPRDDLHARFYEQNPHLRYLNVYDNGFCVCRLTPQRARNEWYVVNTTASTQYSVALDKAVTVDKTGGAGTAALKDA